MQAYTITINLPIEIQSQLQDITNNYLELLKDYTYVQSFEECKDGKTHCHIGYLAPAQKSTSNETRKFNGCYQFTKKEHPNAIAHKQHTNWPILVGYIAKDNTNSQINTNLSLDTLDLYRTNYKELTKQKTEKKQRHDTYTVNQIFKEFSLYYQTLMNETYRHKTKPDLDYHLIHCFMNKIKDNICGTTYQRINKDKLLEFAKFQYEPDKNIFL